MVFTDVSNVVSKMDVSEIRNLDLTHVLYISYDGMTDPLGQSQVLPYLSGLSKEGFKFHLISFEKEEKFKNHREHIQAICDRDGIVKYAVAEIGYERRNGYAWYGKWPENLLVKSYPKWVKLHEN